jgi:hypothetical protein
VEVLRVEDVIDPNTEAQRAQRNTEKEDVPPE